MPRLLTLSFLLFLASFPLCFAAESEHFQRTTIPILDLAHMTQRQFIVDREGGLYLGHPTTVLLDDGKTILCVYPKGHGKGGILYKKSFDGGKTWSDRLPTPENWETSKEVPTLFRTVDANGKKRIIMFSGLYPARLAVSEDEGETWSPLQPVGNWGGIVVMSEIVPLKTGKGHYMAMFHDDGRFFSEKPEVKNPRVFTLYKSLSTDGGVTWSQPETVYQSDKMWLCEPGIVRSPDGTTLAVLLREEMRKANSQIIFTSDEGETWTQPRPLPAVLCGDRHTIRYLNDGRLFISFRDRPPLGIHGILSPTAGDWVGWIGSFDDLLNGTEGTLKIRIMDNAPGSVRNITSSHPFTPNYDCAYPGVLVLPDGTVVTTTYGHWSFNQKPYIVTVRFHPDEWK